MNLVKIVYCYNKLVPALLSNSNLVFLLLSFFLFNVSNTFNNKYF